MAESSTTQVNSAIITTTVEPLSKSANLGWIVAAALALIIIAGFAWMNVRNNEKPKSESAEIRFSIPNSNDLVLSGFLAGVPDFAVSHHGKQFIFLGSDPIGRISIYERALNSLTARVIPGTENAEISFWSPDDQKIAYNVLSGCG